MTYRFKDLVLHNFKHRIDFENQKQKIGHLIFFTLKLKTRIQSSQTQFIIMTNKTYSMNDLIKEFQLGVKRHGFSESLPYRAEPDSRINLLRYVTNKNNRIVVSNNITAVSVRSFISVCEREYNIL